MKVVAIAPAMAAGLLAGCAPQIAGIERFDGGVITPAQGEQAMTECQAKAKVVSASMPSGYGTPGLGPAMADLNAMGAQQNAFTACMAEKGMWVRYAGT